MRCDTCGERLETGEPFTTFDRLHQCAFEAGWDLEMRDGPLGAGAPRCVFSRCEVCVADGNHERITADDLAIAREGDEGVDAGQTDLRPDLEMSTAACPRCGREFQTVVPLDGDDDLRDGFDGWAADLCGDCVIGDLNMMFPDVATTTAALLALTLIALTGAPGRVQVPATRPVSPLQATIGRAIAARLI